MKAFRRILDCRVSRPLAPLLVEGVENDTLSLSQWGHVPFEKRICLLFQTSPHSAQQIEKESTSRVERSFKMAATISLNIIHRTLRFGQLQHTKLGRGSQ